MKTEGPVVIFQSKAKGQQTKPLLAMYSLKKKVVLVVREVGVEIAYLLTSNRTAKFFGYVGMNGPSKGKLLHAKKLNETATRKTDGRTFVLEV